MELTIGCTTRPFNKLTLAEALAHIAEAGYTDVAVFSHGGKVPVNAESTASEIAGVRKAAADAGLRPSMVIGGTRLEQGLDAAVDNYRRLIDNVAAVGATWLLDCGTGNEKLYEDYFELMRRCAPHAQSCGVRITMKPHGGISLTAEDLARAHEKVNHPAFGICYDPGNLVYYTKGARRPGKDATEIASRVSTAIIKDCKVENDVPDVMVTAGDGLVDFPLVLGNLARGGFRGPFYVECVAGTELPRIKRNVAFTLGYVKGILAGFAAG
ncbi:MAG: hypothetical protein A3K19_10375 [Lentisphaerae bacterium RIFOXYB12_FULL_65_16]|nr:MAG: hypothetical protein A3K18_32235 [Lentisphaerae bacterium RIFOXYA12_64_32]OGV91621.1 MAG: hypothetical protein A3K19_10375 [Lentisphaerae bacterium RIFOXYB12_FULL_65_16]